MDAPEYKPPKFTEEQLEYLNFILTPYCCHTSGEHNPSHFGDDPTGICYLQKYKAWEKAVRNLRLNPAAISEPGCYWCNYDDGKVKRKPVEYKPLTKNAHRYKLVEEEK